MSLDPRVVGHITSAQARDAAAGPRGGVTSDGYSLRFSLEGFVRAQHARRAAICPCRRRRRGGGRHAHNGNEILHRRHPSGAWRCLCPVDEINFLSGPGRGVILIKLQKDDDRLLGFIASTGDRDLMTVETTRGAEQTISTAKYGTTGRGGKGRELLQRGEFVRVVPLLPELPAPKTD